MFNQLLETAKTGVERAIAWMNQQLEALGIDLKQQRQEV
jgi:hypothetical protein